MKKVVFLLLFAIVATMGFGQENKTITERLEQKYKLVSFQDSYGGWYSVFTDRYFLDKACEGVCDLKGNEIIPPIYNNVSFYGDYYKVTLNGKVAIRDINNKELFPFKYEDVSWYKFKDGDYADVKLNGKIGVVDKQGNEIVAPKYDEVKTFEFSDDYVDVDVKLNDKVGVIDKQGREIIAPKYENIRSTELKYYENVSVKENGKWGLVNKQGKEVLPCEYSYISNGKESILLVQGGTSVEENYPPTGGKWGMIVNNNISIDCKYDYLSKPSEGLAAFNLGGKITDVKKSSNISGGKWGYIDVATGKEIIPAQYETASDFEYGAAQVSLNGQTTLIENPLQKGITNIGGFGSFTADVDINIPETGAKNEETFAFVFANQDYDKFIVPFAKNDGEVFKEYCTKTLGIPENNIRFYENATVGNMRSAVNRIKEVADAYDGDARFVVYYSGQGITDESSKIPYLLPVDAVLTNLTATGYSVEKLNRELSELSAKFVWLIVDACFNGADKEGKMLAWARGVAVKPKTNLAEGNLILFSATSGSETAYDYKEKNHGLFTYFLLKKLQETKGDITGKALTDYVTTEVKKQSVNNTSIQSPTVIVSDKLTNWQTLKFK